MVELVVNVIVIIPQIVKGDFLVLARSALNASSDFAEGDKIVVTSGGSSVTLKRESGKVLIRPNAIVVGEFTGAPAGRGTLKVVADDLTPKTADIPVRIVDAPLKKKSVIPFGDEKTHYTVGIIANPALQKSEDAEGPEFLPDPILKKRSDFHRRVIQILEAFLERDEDLLRQSDIEPHLRVFTYFDDSLSPNENNALIRRPETTKDSLASRSRDDSKLLPSFLGKREDTKSEKADVLALVSADSTYMRASAWFTTDDGAKTDFTYDGDTHYFGRDAAVPGSFTDTIYAYYHTDADKMTALHEFLHAMSEDEHGKIIDLYNDDFFSSGLNFNKKDRSRVAKDVAKGAGIGALAGAAIGAGAGAAYGAAKGKKASDVGKDAAIGAAIGAGAGGLAGGIIGGVSSDPDPIPADFAEYKGTTYKSDVPGTPPGYKGRGGLGYPGLEEIKKSSQPELQDNSNPNLMDNFLLGSAPASCKLDKLTYQYATDRIKAKFR